VVLGKNIVGLTNEAMDLIFHHHWPGNVRELENVLERSMVLAKGDFITPEHLPPELAVHEPTAERAGRTANLKRLERDHVVSVLEKGGWNKYRAAQMMGISRSTLYSKIRKLGLEHEESRSACAASL
jgi:two-component system, NtrC family, response regulator HydG